jgi:single-strand DNA-binding protein
MARSVNCVHLIGNLTRDPQLRQTASGRPVCSVSLATNRQWKSENGEKHEATEFHKLILWGKLAEIASEYLKKGMKAYFQGRLQTRTYTTPDGSHKFITEIIVGDMLMLSGAPAANKTAEPGQPPQTQPEPEETAGQSVIENFNPDEIPF